jgi:hypothetical protein
LNDCCGLIDAIVAEIGPEPTTTTTTTRIIDCALEGNARVYDCALEGNALEITTTTTTSSTSTSTSTTTTTTTTTPEPPTTTTTTTPIVGGCIGYDLFAAESSSIEWFNCEDTFSTITFTGSFSICTDGSGFTTTIGSVEIISEYPCGEVTTTTTTTVAPTTTTTTTTELISYSYSVRLGTTTSNVCTATPTTVYSDVSIWGSGEMGLWIDAGLTTGISGWNFAVLEGETLIYDLATSDINQYLSGLTSGDCLITTTTTTTIAIDCTLEGNALLITTTTTTTTLV